MTGDSRLDVELDSPSGAAAIAGEPLAGLLRRLGGLCYETILVIPVLFISAYLFLTLTQGVQTQFLRPLLQVWLMAVLAAYFVYCWMRGQTLAMRTWHIRIARPDGTPVTLGQAVLRFMVALIGILLAGACFVWAFIDRDRQFLHDRVAGTRLFNSPRRSKTR
jgi:uncharacterized RDD family membrane protein YckC